MLITAKLIWTKMEIAFTRRQDTFKIHCQYTLPAAFEHDMQEWQCSWQIRITSRYLEYFVSKCTGES